MFCFSREIVGFINLSKHEYNHLFGRESPSQGVSNIKRTDPHKTGRKKKGLTNWQLALHDHEQQNYSAPPSLSLSAASATSAAPCLLSIQDLHQEKAMYYNRVGGLRRAHLADTAAGAATGTLGGGAPAEPAPRPSPAPSPPVRQPPSPRRECFPLPLSPLSLSLCSGFAFCCRGARGGRALFVPGRDMRSGCTGTGFGRDGGGTHIRRCCRSRYCGLTRPFSQATGGFNTGSGV